jgi:hypothetical protein
MGEAPVLMAREITNRVDLAFITSAMDLEITEAYRSMADAIDWMMKYLTDLSV